MVVVLDPPGSTLKLLRESLPARELEDELEKKLSLEDGANSKTKDEDDVVEVLSYVASLASSLASTNDFDPAVWAESLSPYLATIPHLKYDEDCTPTEETVEKFRTACERVAAGDGDETEDEEDGFGGEEICNIRFRCVHPLPTS